MLGAGRGSRRRGATAAAVNGLTKHFPVRGDLFQRAQDGARGRRCVVPIAKSENGRKSSGESGCGQVDHLAAIVHLMKRDARDIVYDGACSRARSVASMSFAAACRWWFQTAMPRSSRLTIEESIAFGPKVTAWPTWLRARWRANCSQSGLAAETFANRYPHEISGGQRQRVNIATRAGLVAASGDS